VAKQSQRTTNPLLPVRCLDLLSCTKNVTIVIFTVADYAAQAVISTIIRAAFPEDPIVGEEDASTLRSPNTQTERDMRDRIVKLANDALTSELMLGDNKNWGIGPGMEKSDIEILDAIDAGSYEGGPDGR
jgi:3'(2'), 5'-bisphosphate nucleotidase